MASTRSSAVACVAVVGTQSCLDHPTLQVFVAATATCRDTIFLASLARYSVATHSANGLVGGMCRDTTREEASCGTNDVETVAATVSTKGVFETVYFEEAFQDVAFAGRVSTMAKVHSGDTSRHCQEHTPIVDVSQANRLSQCGAAVSILASSTSVSTLASRNTGDTATQTMF